MTNPNSKLRSEFARTNLSQNPDVISVMDIHNIYQTKSEELYDRFTALSANVKMLGGIVQNANCGVTRKDMERFLRDTNKVLDDLNRLKNDVLNYLAMCGYY